MTSFPGFAICLNCMDGRVQWPVIRWIRRRCGVAYVDMITEAGMDGVLAGGKAIDGILKKVEISVNRHGSRDIFVVGHDDCAGNPVDEATHQTNIRAAVQCLKDRYEDCRVSGLWVTTSGDIVEVT